MQQPTQSALSENALSSIHTSNYEALRPEAEWPPVIVLRPPSGNAAPPIICISCEEPRAWLFPHAAELAGCTTQADLAEDEDDAHLLNQLRQARAGDWYTAVSATNGPHKGLRGVGLGSKQKSRKRAARLALATHARVMDGGPVENPSGDGDFLLLVETVRSLLGTSRKVTDHADSMSQNGSPPPPPPPPPGVPPQAACRVQPPPPPPPIEDFNVMESLPAQDETADCSPRSAQPWDLPHDQVSETGAKSAHSAETGPSETGRTAEQLLDWFMQGSATSNMFSSASSQPMSHPHSLGAGLGPPVQHTPCDNFAHGPQGHSSRPESKFAMATAMYHAEGDGYLSLSYGDTLELLHDRIEPSSVTDLYPRYAYGTLLNEARYHARMIGREIAGWFPYDLCRPLPRHP